MILFIQNIHLLNNNQQNVNITVKKPLKMHGNNLLIIGANKCSKMFLNFKFSLFSRFKVHAFNNKKVEIFLMYEYDKSGFFDNRLSKNQSLYFQKNNIITFLNNNIFENFNSNSLIMIDNNFFFNSTKYFKAVYFKPIKYTIQKGKVYSFCHKKAYMFLDSRVYKGKNRHEHLHRNEILNRTLSSMYGETHFNLTLFQEIEEGSFFGRFSNLVHRLFTRSISEDYIKNYSSVSEYILIVENILHNVITEEFFEFLSTAFTLEYGQENPIDIFERVDNFIIENRDQNKIQNEISIKSLRSVLKFFYIEKYNFKFLENEYINKLDKKLLESFLKINLNQRLSSTFSGFINMRNIFINIVLIETQKTFLNVDLDDFVKNYYKEAHAHSLKKDWNVTFISSFDVHWYDYRAPHIEFISNVYSQFIIHPDISKYIESEEFLFFLRYALNLIENKTFIKQMLISFDTTTYNSLENKSLKIKKKTKELNLLKKNYIDCFGYEYSKKFISIDNIKLNS
jgi:hypothetical protein